MDQAVQQVITQAEFAQLVGVSEARVSQLMSEGVLTKGQPFGAWLDAYLGQLRAQAAARQGSGGLDLVQERAALARAQREAQELRNASARAEYASTAVLTEVLGVVRAGLVDRMDELPGTLDRACPNLPEAARQVVHQVLASARNEWLRAAASLADADRLESAEDDPAVDLDDDGAAAED